MTQSMTGFARGSVTTPSFAVIVELRSVNNRFLDLHFRCPDNLRSEETQWRKLIGEHVDRGKIEVAFKLQLEAGTEAISLNKAKLAQLGTALGEISEILPNAKQPDTLAILQTPGTTFRTLAPSGAPPPMLHPQLPQPSPLTCLNTITGRLRHRHIRRHSVASSPLDTPPPTATSIWPQARAPRRAAMPPAALPTWPA